MALTKANLAEHLFLQLGINKSEAKEIVEQVFEEIRTALESGEQVKISGFGNFNLRDKRSRPGRNPRTGDLVPVSERRVVTFKASSKLRLQVENQNTAEN